jgi:hypothetical protein
VQETTLFSYVFFAHISSFVINSVSNIIIGPIVCKINRSLSLYDNMNLMHHSPVIGGFGGMQLKIEMSPFVIALILSERKIS